MKILHLSDTHLLNLKRHDEFKIVFNEIYRIAKEQKVDYIIHCGDIAHTKTQISPEFVEMATKFLRSLSEIAPTFVILGNHDCFSADHEILTKKDGWQNISEYVNANRNDEIATFSTNLNQIVFEKPIGLIKKMFNGELINLISPKADLLVTPTHQILYKNNSSDVYHKKIAEEISLNDYIPLNGLSGDTTNDYFYNLLGFCLADATFVLRKHKSAKKQKYDSCRVQFHFKKEKKIEYLSSLLNNLNYKFNINYQKDGTVFMRIYGDLAKKIISFFEAQKSIPNSIYSCSNNEIKSFIDGYLNGDGSKITKNTWTCTSISEQNAINLVTLSRFVGYMSHISDQEVYGKFKNSKRQYVFYITKNNITNNTGIDNIKKIKHEDYVYCVTVPNSNILIKRNDKICITGNCNLKNDTRTDAISPIVNAISSENLKLFKYSEEYSLNDEVNLNILSRIDEENWKKPSDPSKINIALYHGAISGVKTDGGYTLENGEHNITALEGHDYAFLGDIHKSNQIVDTEGRVRYPGSTVQGNFGEFDDKGFLIWDIQSKDKFSCQHFIIPNPKPYLTIDLDDEGNLPDIDVKDGSRVRIMTSKNISLEKTKRATEIIKNRFNPESVIFVNKALASSSDAKHVSEIVSNNENLRDGKVQENLITDFLKDYKAEEEVMQNVIKLNEKYSSMVEDTDETKRNVKWKLKNLQWDNLFNYGEGNSINFDNLRGIVGVFGKNYSGKSSVIDSLLYTIYNTTSKNNRKNLNVINQTKDKGSGRVEIEIDGENYVIDRASEKYTKKLKGVITTEAKTDVEFTSDAGSLNGLARNDTDNSIRKYFGTVDDFFLTSMASQFGYLSFISEGSTKRKEILAKFLDLEMFEKKFKLAKEESAELKALLKKLEGNNFDRDITNTELELAQTHANITHNQKQLDEFKEEIEKLNDELKTLKEQLNATPVDVSNYFKLHNSLVLNKQKVETLTNSNISYKEENSKLNTLISKLESFIKLVNYEQLIKDDAELDKIRDQMVPLEKEIDSLEKNIKGYAHKLKLLEDIPCGDQFTSCKFIKDAFQAKEKMATDQRVLLDHKHNYSILDTRYSELDEKTTSGLNKHGEATKKKKESEDKRSKNELQIANNLLLIEKLTSQIEKDQQEFDEQEKNRELIEKFDELKKKNKNLEQNLQLTKGSYEARDRDLRDFYKKEGSLKQKIENLNEQKENLEKTRKEYSAYDLYLKCMHPSGITYEIIKNKLPAINEEIAKILNGVVNFGVFLENDDDKLDIMIKHPNSDARPLEMGSGAEKTLASTAIRIALNCCTTLPRPELLILDEPATALDQENIDGFIKILQILKEYYKTIIVISHLDQLKECVDSQIEIINNNGYAFINI